MRAIRKMQAFAPQMKATQKKYANDKQRQAAALQKLHVHDRRRCRRGHPPHRAGWFPNLVGTEQVRYYRFEDGHLVLNADTAWGTVRIIWEKL